MNPIPYGRHHITESDIQAVVDVLRSNNLTQGPKVAEFETAFAAYIGCKYAIAVANGTAALHLSAIALNLLPGQKVITTPITFAATANCVRYCGGDVVFADIDPLTLLLDIKKVREILKSSPKGIYKGLIPVDFTGRAINLEAFRKLADEFDLWLIEDACHSPGGFFFDGKGVKQNCGNGMFADLAIFSFHPVKHIAAGEGGMITTNNKDLYEKIKKLRSHGIKQNSDIKINNPGVWYYEMSELGYNYRLSDISSALAKSQLSKASERLERRKEIAENYQKAFKGKSWLKSQSGIVTGHAYHLYIIEIENRNELLNFLYKQNVFAQVHYIPLHLMPYYRQFGWKEGDLPFAEKYYSNCLSIPMFPSLTNEDQSYIINLINTFYETAVPG